MAVGLVEGGEGWLRLHRLLVYFGRQEELDPDAKPAVARTLIRCGEEAGEGNLTGSAVAAVTPHVVYAAGTMSDGTDDEPLAAELCTAAGRALQHAGDLRGARPWLQQAVAIWDGLGDPEDHRAATSLLALGRLLEDQGELASARPLLERALAIRERALGPKHPDTAMSPGLLT